MPKLIAKQQIYIFTNKDANKNYTQQVNIHLYNIKILFILI